MHPWPGPSGRTGRPCSQTPMDKPEVIVLGLLAETDRAGLLGVKPGHWHCQLSSWHSSWHSLSPGIH